MPAVQQHRQSHKRSTELTVSCLGLSKKQVFLFKFGSFGLVTGARIEAPGHTAENQSTALLLRRFLTMSPESLNEMGFTVYNSVLCMYTRLKTLSSGARKMKL